VTTDSDDNIPTN